MGTSGPSAGPSGRVWGFEALDNGFRSVEDADALLAICARDAAITA